MKSHVWILDHGVFNTKNYLSNNVKISNFAFKLLRDFIKISIFIFKGLFIKRKFFLQKYFCFGKTYFLPKKLKIFILMAFLVKQNQKVELLHSLSKTNKRGSIGLNQLVGFNEKFKMFFFKVYLF